MQIVQALQLEDTKRWNMTVRTNSRRAHGIGYCGGWRYDELIKSCEERHPDDGIHKGLIKEREKMLSFKHKYHDDGHETSAEAMACWIEFILDKYLRFDKAVGVKKKCMVCESWTTIYGHTPGPYSGYNKAFLCSRHANKKNMKKFLNEEIG